MIRKPRRGVVTSPEPGMPRVITAQNTRPLRKRVANDPHLRMERRGLDIERPRRAFEIEVHRIIAAVLAISLFQWRKNLSRALKAGHQHRGANVLQRANDGVGPALNVAKAAQ